ncbi:four-carbon acid sugar kinase family protein [Sphingobacterium sp. DN00404]|uniref:Four-carbon acid sugar kinase family protein n=1 Tax=Sphingobacterium micropteri TaxID=2763501 RepID=A0ABR7YPI0_9SPHI|nr:four-carbon acid sugar kinase family protein [Sphingobacterium micropteri]MBD1433238.1 four-carbon acid sugar kinase family protein [Sphingobacterium micropteri]
MSILVIADDLTGAAEIGGIALRYGLSVEIVHTCAVSTDKDVQILNTNTRSLKANEVLAHLRALFAADFSYRWDWIYLKFDSALRGHIVAEISFYREAFQKDNVVFCPVNPALGRVIANGLYWVEGKPIGETDFARDPEFPVRKSGVLEAIGAETWMLAEEVPIAPHKDMPYTVAAVRDMDDLNRWAASSTSFGIYAGAAAFFEALLHYRMSDFSTTVEDEPFLKSPLLYVCGSNHAHSIQRVKNLNTDDVIYWRHIGEEEELARNICQKINKSGKVVFAVEPSHRVEARIIRTSMAQVVALVQQHCAVQELLIEGGATARAVLEALHIDTLWPIWVYGQGVIRNDIPGTTWTVTLKPGSYPWTDKLWVF